MRKEGGGFTDEPEYPSIAIDEAVVNAVAHSRIGVRATVPTAFSRIFYLGEQINLARGKVSFEMHHGVKSNDAVRPKQQSLKY